MRSLRIHVLAAAALFGAAIALAACADDTPATVTGFGGGGTYHIGLDADPGAGLLASPGTLIGIQLNVPAATTVHGIGFYNYSGKPVTAGVGVYSDTGGGLPFALVTATSGTTAPAGLAEIPLPAAALPAGNYWAFVAVEDPAGITLGTDSTVTVLTCRVNSGSTLIDPAPTCDSPGDPQPLFQRIIYLIVAD